MERYKLHLTCSTTLNTSLKSPLPDKDFKLSELVISALYLCLLSPGSSRAHLVCPSSELGSPSSARIYASPVTRSNDREQVLLHEALQKHEIRDHICPKELMSFVDETANGTEERGRH